MEKLKKIGKYILVTPIILFLIGFAIENVYTCPDHALLFVDEQTNEYFAPPCLMSEGFDNIDKINQFAIEHNLKVYTDKELDDKKIDPNHDCRERGGFVEDRRSLSGELLEEIGILPNFKTRWNADGSWKK